MSNEPTLTPTDRMLARVILEAYRKGFTVQSAYARAQADYLAMAASLGLVSTRVYGHVFSREWRPTLKGLAFANQALELDLEAMEGMDAGHD
jgi:hypothetical protein